MTNKMTALQQKFNEFHSDNPHVWELFKSFTAELIHSGYTRLSASLVIERIRWETAIVTKGDPFKICNNHTAYYARLWNNTFDGPARFTTKRSYGQQIMENV